MREKEEGKALKAMKQEKLEKKKLNRKSSRKMKKSFFVKLRTNAQTVLSRPIIRGKQWIVAFAEMSTAPLHTLKRLLSTQTFPFSITNIPSHIYNS